MDGEDVEAGARDPHGSTPVRHAVVQGTAKLMVASQADAGGPDAAEAGAAGAAGAAAKEPSDEESLATESLSCDRPGCVLTNMTSSGRCGSCHTVFYCSRRCQKQDWQRHCLLCISLEMEDQSLIRYDRFPDLGIQEAAGIPSVAARRKRLQRLFVVYRSAFELKRKGLHVKANKTQPRCLGPVLLELCAIMHKMACCHLFLGDAIDGAKWMLRAERSYAHYLQLGLRRPEPLFDDGWEQMPAFLAYVQHDKALAEQCLVVGRQVVLSLEARQAGLTYMKIYERKLKAGKTLLRFFNFAFMRHDLWSYNQRWEIMHFELRDCSVWGLELQDMMRGIQDRAGPGWESDDEWKQVMFYVHSMRAGDLVRRLVCTPDPELQQKGCETVLQNCLGPSCPMLVQAKMLCSRCHAVVYCSRACQTQGWGEHRAMCERLQGVGKRVRSYECDFVRGAIAAAEGGLANPLMLHIQRMCVAHGAYVRIVLAADQAEGHHNPHMAELLRSRIEQHGRETSVKRAESAGTSYAERRQSMENTLCLLHSTMCASQCCLFLGLTSRALVWVTEAQEHYKTWLHSHRSNHANPEQTQEEFEQQRAAGKLLAKRVKFSRMHVLYYMRENKIARLVHALDALPERDTMNLVLYRAVVAWAHEQTGWLHTQRMLGRQFYALYRLWRLGMRLRVQYPDLPREAPNNLLHQVMFQMDNYDQAATMLRGAVNNSTRSADAVSSAEHNAIVRDMDKLLQRMCATELLFSVDAHGCLDVPESAVRI